MSSIYTAPHRSFISKYILPFIPSRGEPGLSKGEKNGLLCLIGSEECFRSVSCLRQECHSKTRNLFCFLVFYNKVFYYKKREFVFHLQHDLYPGQNCGRTGVYPRNTVCEEGLCLGWNANPSNDTNTLTHSHLQAVYRSWKETRECGGSLHNHSKIMRNSTQTLSQAQNRTWRQNLVGGETMCMLHYYYCCPVKPGLYLPLSMYARWLPHVPCVPQAWNQMFLEKHPASSGTFQWQDSTIQEPGEFSDLKGQVQPASPVLSVVLKVLPEWVLAGTFCEGCTHFSISQTPRAIHVFQNECFVEHTTVLL